MRKIIFFLVVAIVAIAIFSLPRTPLVYETTALSYDSVKGVYGLEQQIQFAGSSAEDQNIVTRFRVVDEVLQFSGESLKPTEGMIVTTYYAPTVDFIYAGEVPLNKIRWGLFAKNFAVCMMIFLSFGMVAFFLLICVLDCRLLKEKYLCRVRKLKHRPEGGGYYVDAIFTERLMNSMLPWVFVAISRDRSVEINKVYDFKTRKTVVFEEGDEVTLLFRGGDLVKAYKGNDVPVRQLVEQDRRKLWLKLVLDMAVAIIWMIFLLKWAFFY